MLRTIWFYIWLVLGSLVLGTFVSIAGRLDWDAGVRWTFYLWGRLLVAAAGGRVEADLSALPEERDVVIMANHQSYLDIPLIFSLLCPRRKVSFVAKESLFRVPVFGRAMRDSGHVAVNRENQRKAMKAIDQAVARSNTGYTVSIFPEGTRTYKPEGLGGFQIGGMILALKCGLPVAPIVHEGAAAIWAKGRWKIGPPPRRIKVKALPLLETEGRYTLKERERFRDDLYALMNNAYLELRHGSE